MALVFGLDVTADELNSSPALKSRSDLDARSFESFKILIAALAFLLNLFFAFGITKTLNFS